MEKLFVPHRESEVATLLGKVRLVSAESREIGAKKFVCVVRQDNSS